MNIKQMENEMTEINLENGKYIIQHTNGTNFKALRHGEDWRDLTGDGLILALCQRIDELQAYDVLNKAKIAESLHERDKLGHAVVKVITAIEDLIAGATEYEDDDGFTYQSSPLDLWSALNDALEDMPKLAGEDKLARLELENKTLREAFKTHSRHLTDCNFLRKWIDSDCNCGLFKILSTPTSTEQKDKP